VLAVDAAGLDAGGAAGLEAGAAAVLALAKVQINWRALDGDHVAGQVSGLSFGEADKGVALAATTATTPRPSRRTLSSVPLSIFQAITACLPVRFISALA